MSVSSISAGTHVLKNIISASKSNKSKKNGAPQNTGQISAEVLRNFNIEFGRINQRDVDAFFNSFDEAVPFSSPNIFEGDEFEIYCYLNMRTLKVFSTWGNEIGRLKYEGWHANTGDAEKIYLWRVLDRRGKLVGKFEIFISLNGNGKISLASSRLSSMAPDENGKLSGMEVVSSLIFNDSNEIANLNLSLVEELMNEEILPEDVLISTPDDPSAELIPALEGQEIVPLYYTEY